MRPTKRFVVLHRSAANRLQRLRNIAAVATHRPVAMFSEANREVSYVTIELHTTITNFARAYFLSCTLNPVTESGTRISCMSSVTSAEDAIDAAMKACKFSAWKSAGGRKLWDRREEPPWHQPATLMKSCQEIGCTHHANIVAAFSLPASVFIHLTKARNFFAHRTDSTATQARAIASSYSISITGNEHPSRVLCVPAYSRPQPLILDWIDDVENVVGLLCQ